MNLTIGLFSVFWQLWLDQNPWFHFLLWLGNTIHWFQSSSLDAVLQNGYIFHIFVEWEIVANFSPSVAEFIVAHFYGSHFRILVGSTISHPF